MLSGRILYRETRGYIAQFISLLLLSFGIKLLDGCEWRREWRHGNRGFGWSSIASCWWVWSLRLCLLTSTLHLIPTNVVYQSIQSCRSLLTQCELHERLTDCVVEISVRIIMDLEGTLCQHRHGVCAAEDGVSRCTLHRRELDGWLLLDA